MKKSTKGKGGEDMDNQKSKAHGFGGGGFSIDIEESDRKPIFRLITLDFPPGTTKEEKDKIVDDFKRTQEAPSYVKVCHEYKIAIEICD